eukprot:TRINITY_DN24273_c0_g2_i1.p1 TRINITY_DN24273_c0_g2~~TRINITY_DN24273_c0_g2_i1.p1  ORF type:complete len:848 (-),score=112.16 TRINITY_DN24273_c0_g2_i1:174-2459(-)
MNAMVFIACRMFVVSTTEGIGDVPTWVEACMIVSTVGLILQTLLVFFLPALAKDKALEILSIASIAGERSDVHPLMEQATNDDSILFDLLVGVQLVLVGMIHGGSLGVVAGVCTFQLETTRVFPAVIATCLMGTIYIGVCVFLFVARLGEDLPLKERQGDYDDEGYFRRVSLARAPFTAGSAEDKLVASLVRHSLTHPLVHAAQAMTTSARKAPMIAAIFLTARMRASHLDPPDGTLPPWAHVLFMCVTLALLLEIASAAYVGKISRHEFAYYGAHYFKRAGLATALHYLFCGCVFASLVPIFACIAEMKSSDGTEEPWSSTTTGVLLLAALYIAIDFVQWISFILGDFLNMNSSVFRDTVVAARVSCRFVPVLATLFIACRMHALQLTQQRASPQRWAQDLMFVSVSATFLQTVCCICTPVFTNLSTHVDADGNTEYDIRPLMGAYVLTLIKWVAMLALHVGVWGQCVAIVIMTPGTTEGSEHGVDINHFSLRGIFVLLLVVLIGAVLSSAKVVGLAVKFAIEALDESVLGAQIEVASAKLSIFDGYVTVHGLKIYNPVAEDKPWRCDHILSLDRALVKINVWKLIRSFGLCFEITALILEGLEVHVEKPSLKGMTNLSCVLAHLKETTSPKLQEEAAMCGDVLEVALASQAVGLIIHKVFVHDIRCFAIPPRQMGPKLTVCVAPINFDDFHKRLQQRTGDTVSTVLSLLLKTILESIAESAMSGFKFVGLAPSGCVKSISRICSPSQRSPPASVPGLGD